MYLEMITHVGLAKETSDAIVRLMPRQLQRIVKEHFGLDLRDASELQVLPPVVGWTPEPGMFVFWTLRGVLNLGGRNFHTAKAAITAALTEIFAEYEVPAGERFSVRGVIPYVGSMSNTVEDMQPVVFPGRKPVSPPAA
ncbi:MAG: hypothetical protein A3H70_05500 [Candidatus Komeilibacteria bacterium RIFCSPLOWO2_02_FULL_48_11]|uniref:Uncharacterized protein n=1 Tax=Candidatus Komeilibacteria bacterium RIFCSPLOWO2_02_FULL_48_11 TaxID=1798553 RepID=A0A1G2BVV4_9BACT|nr:MAG: hypothetical protein A3H70_05500 [Candidatus Komeilibacteria bacterium RIFCSPLOWO2_02_FULL_48_11]